MSRFWIGTQQGRFSTDLAAQYSVDSPDDVRSYEMSWHDTMPYGVMWCGVMRFAVTQGHLTLRDIT